MNAMHKLQTPARSLRTLIGMNSRKPVLVASVLALVISASAVSAAETSWNYSSYNSGKVFSTGYITLSESASGATLQFVANRMDSCFRGQQPASVVRTPEGISIIVSPRMSGCAELRFTLKADGTGGIRETKVDGNWVPDGLDRGLTLR